MAKGGKRRGAGRPKGSVTRPQFRDYFSEKERVELIEMIKTHMVDDMRLLQFAAEQIFGKAPQTLETPDGEKVAVAGFNIILDENHRADSSAD